MKMTKANLLRVFISGSKNNVLIQQTFYTCSTLGKSVHIARKTFKWRHHIQEQLHAGQEQSSFIHSFSEDGDRLIGVARPF